jgi:hypothetical protein
MNGDLAYRREDGWTIFELTLPAAIDEKPGVNGHASNGARNASPAKAEVSRT